MTTLKANWSRAFGGLQKIGKALMLPVSVLPVAGILLGVGSSLAGADSLPQWLIGLGGIMAAAGGAVFTILPLIFAIGVALGFTRNDGVAALAATVGYFVLIAALGVISLGLIHLTAPVAPLTLSDGQVVQIEQDHAHAQLVCLDNAGRILTTSRIQDLTDHRMVCPGAQGQDIVVPFELRDEDTGTMAYYQSGDGTLEAFPPARSRAEIKQLFGMDSIDTGVFGGILIGLIAALLFNRYYRISLPPYLGFFAGKRFVPIVVAFAAIALAAVLAVIWPPIGGAIRNFGNWAAYSNPAAAVTTYGIVERALLPFGLHHIWNVPFFFEVGTYIDPETGKTVHGILSRFFAGDHAAAILGGGFVFKMFGLPAAALAIYHAARPENKARVAGIMGSAALTSFLTGITEPLEFTFMFVAPLLYALHALLAGAAYLVTYLLGARLGYAFSHGFIDYALYWVNDIRPWMILIIGPVFAVIYYGLFRWLIALFDLKTPGRELLSPDHGEARATAAGEFTRELVLACGGKSNIVGVDACITRLRIELTEIDKANPDQFKALGAAGVVVVGNNMQAIFGPRSENLMVEMEEYLKSAGPEAELPEGDAAPKVRYKADDLRPRHRDPYAPDRARALLAALGGARNIKLVEACAQTRLRVILNDSTQIKESALNAATDGVMYLDDKLLHLLVGLNADQYGAEMRAAMADT